MLIRKLCDRGAIIRAAAKGWKGNQYSYALFNRWLPDIVLRTDNPESARMETIRRYLKCYGPASLEDIAWWVGLPLAQVRRTVTNLRREALKFSVEGFREELFGLRETQEEIHRPQNDSDAIQLLPPWDPFLLGWQNKKRLARKEFLPYLFDSSGNATSTITYRGKAIGIWQFRDFLTNILEFHVFEPYQYLKKEAVRVCEQHARQLASLSGATTVDIIEKGLPPSLDKCPPGAFLWPLGKSLPNHRAAHRQVTPTAEKRQQNTFRGSYLDHQYVVGTAQVEQSTR